MFIHNLRILNTTDLNMTENFQTSDEDILKQSLSYSCVHIFFIFNKSVLSKKSYMLGAT